MLIIDDILTSPVKGLWYIFKKVHQLAEEEVQDTSEKLKEKLLEAQTLFETDQIGEEEYQKKEQDILKRLEILSKEKKI